MLKAILYIGLASIGSILALFSPLAGAIACIDAYLFNPSVMGMPDGGFRYQLVVNLAFLIGLLIHRPKGVDRVGSEGWVLKALWIFIAIGFASAAWALASPETTLEFMWEMFKTVLFSALMVRVIHSERDFSLIIMAGLIGVAHAAILHVFGVKYGYVGASYGREMGVLPDPQMAVSLLFIPLLLILAMLGQRYERILSWLALPVVLDSLVVSYERTAFVALAAELVLIMLFVPMRVKLRLAPVLGLGLVLFFYRLTPDDYWKWIGTIEAPTEEASANSRFAIGRVSWQIFLDHPFGVGYRNYPDVSPKYLPESMLTNGKRAAHNNYFTIACDTGIEGFVPWISAFLGACWMLRRIRKRADVNRLTRIEIYAMGMEIGLYGWMVTGFFHNTHEVDPAYWFAALAVVLTRLHAQQVKAKTTVEGGLVELSPGDSAGEQSAVGAR